MKQYLTQEQTAKLIELGFAPKMRIKGVCTKYGIVNVEHETYFDVGGLIEMLPEKVTDKHEHDAILQITCFNGEWRVKYAGAYDIGLMIAHELIDALYYMLIDLLENDLIHLRSNEGTKDN